MAVNREPILKRCKYLGISPMVMGVAKETKRDPNANKRKKVSEYGLQLKEKQKLRFIYGVLEKQFHHYFEIAQKMEGQAGTNLLTILESRLDSVVFRMGLSMTRREARQLVVHSHYTVNGKKVNIPSYQVKPEQQEEPQVQADHRNYCRQSCSYLARYGQGEPDCKGSSYAC